MRQLQELVNDDERIADEGTFLNFRKIVESHCQGHYLYQTTHRHCSQFCHNYTKKQKEADLDDVILAMCNLWIMIRDMCSLPDQKIESHVIIESQKVEIQKPEIQKSEIYKTEIHKVEDQKLESEKIDISQNGAFDWFSREIQPEQQDFIPAKPQPTKPQPTKIRVVQYRHLRCKLYPDCIKGDNCPYVHREEEFQLADCSKTQICNYWLQGICKFQSEPDRCGFAHGHQDLKSKKMKNEY